MMAAAGGGFVRLELLTYENSGKSRTFVTGKPSPKPPIGASLTYNQVSDVLITCGSDVRCGALRRNLRWLPKMNPLHQ
jgi:hypothetical protein